MAKTDWVDRGDGPVTDDNTVDAAAMNALGTQVNAASDAITALETVTITASSITNSTAVGRAVITAADAAAARTAIGAGTSNLALGTSSTTATAGDVAIRKDSNVINVKTDFGAVGNGTANDTAAINAAIAALTPGATLYFPPGRYMTDGGHVITQPSVLIRGSSGRAQTFNTSGQLFLRNGANADMLTIAANQVTVRDLSLHGNYNNQTGTSRGLVTPSTASSNYLLLDAVWVSSFNGDGFSFDSSGGTLSMTVVNCESRFNQGYGMKFLAGSTDSMVSSCYIDQNVLSGVHISAGDISLTSCHIWGNGTGASGDRDGITCQSAAGVRIINCYIETQANAAGIRFKTGTNKGHIVSDCDIWNNGTQGIYAFSATNCIFSNNVVRANGDLGGSGVNAAGIVLDACTSISIIGNTMFNAAGGGQTYGFYENGSSNVEIRFIGNTSRAADHVTGGAFLGVGTITSYTNGGTDVALADGGTGASLTDPGADRILFWDDSASTMTWLTVGSGLSLSGTTITATGGGGGTGIVEAIVEGANINVDNTDPANPIISAEGLQTQFITNVKDFGAVGNGVADDTAEIQAALTAAASSGGMVWIPKGTYKISSTLTVPNGVSVSGPGAAHAIISTTDTIIMMIVGVTSTGAGDRYGEVGGFKLDGNTAATIGLHVAATCVQRRFEGIEIVDIAGPAYLLDATQNTKFVDCDSIDCVIGWRLVNDAASNTFDNCEVSGALTTGLVMENDAALPGNALGANGTGLMNGAGPSNNVWFKCLFERGTMTNCVKIVRGNRNRFIACDFVHYGNFAMVRQVDLQANAKQNTFAWCVFAGTAEAGYEAFEYAIHNAGSRNKVVESDFEIAELLTGFIIGTNNALHIRDNTFADAYQIEYTGGGDSRRAGALLTPFPDKRVGTTAQRPVVGSATGPFPYFDVDLNHVVWWDGNSYEDPFVPTTRTVSAGTGLTGGGDLSTNRSFAVAYGTTGTTAAVGNDARLSDARTPAAASITAAMFAAAAIVTASEGLASSDNDTSFPTTAAVNAGLATKAPTARTITAGTGLTGGGDLSADRTLTVAYGSTSTTAAVGNDARLSDVRTPAAASITAAMFTAATIVTAAEGVASSDNDTSFPTTAAVNVALATKVPTTRTVTAGTGLTGGGDLSANRTLVVAYGSTSTTAAVGNDARLSDTRTPTDGTVTTAKFVAGSLTTQSEGIGANDSDTQIPTSSAVKRYADTVSWVTKTASYALVLADLGSGFLMNVATANTLTVPTNATQAIPIGAVIPCGTIGAGQVTVTPADGTVTLRSRVGLKSAGQYAEWSLTKIGTNEWLVTGDLVVA